MIAVTVTPCFSTYLPYEFASEDARSIIQGGCSIWPVAPLNSCGLAAQRYPAYSFTGDLQINSLAACQKVYLLVQTTS